MTRLEIGRVARPHGLRGQVVVELWTNRAERLDPGSRLTTSDPSGTAPSEGELTVATSSPHLGRWIVSFEEVTDHPGAQALRGVVLLAEPIEDPDALWIHDLIGSELLDLSGRSRGRVTAVEANPASDLLVLDGGGLVPLRFVVEHRPGVVVADLPEGLLD